MANWALASALGGVAATSLQPLKPAHANKKTRPAANALTGSLMAELTLNQLPPAARPPPRAKVNKPLSRSRQQPDRSLLGGGAALSLL
jgi:hypothetical protein